MSNTISHNLSLIFGVHSIKSDTVFQFCENFDFFLILSANKCRAQFWTNKIAKRPQMAAKHHVFDIIFSVLLHFYQIENNSCFASELILEQIHLILKKWHKC